MRQPVRISQALGTLSARVLLLLSIACALTSCARTTDEIPATFNEAGYVDAASCPQLFDRRARLQEQLVFAGIAQNQVAREDRERLFGVVPSMFGTFFRGDESRKVGALKGEMTTLDLQLVATGCVAPID